MNAHGWELIAAFPHRNGDWLVVGEDHRANPQADPQLRFVSAWARQPESLDWHSDQYTDTLGKAIRAGLERVGFDVEPITIH